jgi:hypothetical protein
MADHLPPPMLEYEYAPPVSRTRRFRVLPPPVAITLVVCGTILVGAPSMLASSEQRYIRDDQLALLWAAGGVGLLAILLGTFLCAPAREPPPPNSGASG